jgi:hypothetical protein
MLLSRFTRDAVDHRWWAYARLPDWRVIAVGGLILGAVNAPFSALLDFDAGSDYPQLAALWLVANAWAAFGTAAGCAGITWLLSRRRTIVLRAPIAPAFSYALYAAAGLLGGSGWVRSPRWRLGPVASGWRRCMSGPSSSGR